MIKDTKEFNVNDLTYTEGTKAEQEQMNSQLSDITTNLSNTWKDMADIKQRLWIKLHGVSSGLKKNIDHEMNKLA